MRIFLIALVSFGLGVLAHRWWSDASKSGVRTDTPRRDSGSETAELAAARAETTKLRGELKRLQTSERAAETVATAASRPADTPFEAGGEPTKARGPRFTDPKSEQTIRKVSWKPAGDALNKLMPLLTEANEVAYGRKPMRNELWGEIMASIGPIITVAIQLETNGVSWSHPTVQLNLLDATLSSAGKPLVEQQVEPIQALGLQYVDADTRRKEAYGATVTAVRKRLDKSKLQGQLFAAVEPILTAEQKAVLWPAGVRGIVALDVFSAASLWDEHLEHMAHAGRESLRHSVSNGLAKHMVLREELGPQLLQVVTEWEQGFADKFLLASPDKVVLGDVKMNRTARVLATAEAQARLFASILTRLPLNAVEKQKLIDLDMVYVPIYMASAPSTGGEEE
ncbi:MAG: hypothetical protein ACYS0F_15225 [Planctomycetota bacterium]|jgi:hypothetical protein